MLIKMMMIDLGSYPFVAYESGISRPKFTRTKYEKVLRLHMYTSVFSDLNCYISVCLRDSNVFIQSNKQNT